MANARAALLRVACGLLLVAGCGAPATALDASMGGGGGNSGGDASTGAVQGTGQACARNDDCPSGVCLPVGGGRNACTTTCRAAADCVAGWSCAALVGQPGDICQCTAAPERCDGQDDDCNGVIDDGPVDADCVARLGAPATCMHGSCVCATSCGTACVDTATDPANCGGCGHACSVANAAASCVAGACTFSCEAGWGDCDGMPGNGCEHDLSGDAANCGACGADCGGGKCQAGACQAFAVLTDPALSEYWSYVVEGDSIYYASPNDPTNVVPGEMFRASSRGGGGGAPQKLATGLSAAHLVGADATNVYYTELLTGGYPRVARVPLGGGAAVTLADLPSSNLIGSVFRQGHVYVMYVDIHGVSITSVDAATGAMTMTSLAASAVGNVVAFVADDAYLWWLNYNTADIWRMPLGGVGASRFAPTSEVPSMTLAVDASGAYVNSAQGYGLYLFPYGGGPTTRMTDPSIDTSTYSFLQADGARVYFIAYTTAAATIQWLPEGGGGGGAFPTTLFSAPPTNDALNHLQVTADAVYWMRTDSSTTKIWKVGKH
jgi:hypothetical protein